MAILRELDRRERAELGPPTFADLAELLKISSAAVTKHILRLRRLGLVTEATSQYRSLGLTDAGREFMAELGRGM